MAIVQSGDRRNLSSSAPRRCTPTSSSASTSTSTTRGRGGALRVESRESRKSSQVAAAKARRLSGRFWPPIGARQAASVDAGWVQMGPVEWSTATSPLMRCLPGVRT